MLHPIHSHRSVVQANVTGIEDDGDARVSEYFRKLRKVCFSLLSERGDNRGRHVCRLLLEFLKAWLPDKRFSIDLTQHLGMTDNEVNAAMMRAAYDPSLPGHRHARAVFSRDHFRLIYERNPRDIRINPKATEAVSEFLLDKFGKDSIHWYINSETNKRIDFPVRRSDGSIISSLDESTVLSNIPVVMTEFVFVSNEKRGEAESCVKNEIASIIKLKKEGEP